MSREFVYESTDEAATEKLGAALAAALPPQAVIALIGPLGAGKTRLVQAVASAAGVPDGVVASPTFVLVHEYEGNVPIYHFDAYRLANEREFAALGPEEYFARPGWSFIEWADRVTASLPADRLEISIEPSGEMTRRITVSAKGDDHANVITRLTQQLNRP